MDEEADGSDDSGEGAVTHRKPARITRMSRAELSKRRKLTYSRVYHRERVTNEAAGMDVEKSKELARCAAQMAVQEELFAD